jgi:hypothetical protein
MCPVRSVTYVSGHSSGVQIERAQETSRTRENPSQMRASDKTLGQQTENKELNHVNYDESNVVLLSHAVRLPSANLGH